MQTDKVIISTFLTLSTVCLYTVFESILFLVLFGFLVLSQIIKKYFKAEVYVFFLISCLSTTSSSLEMLGISFLGKNVIFLLPISGVIFLRYRFISSRITGLYVYILLFLIVSLSSIYSLPTFMRIATYAGLFGWLYWIVNKFSLNALIQSFVDVICILVIYNAILYFIGYYDAISYDFGLTVSRLFIGNGGLNPNRFALMVGFAYLLHRFGGSLELKRVNIKLGILLFGLALTYTRTVILSVLLVEAISLLVKRRYVLFATILFLSSLSTSFLFELLQRGESETNIEQMSSRSLIWAEIISDFDWNSFSILVLGYGPKDSRLFFDNLTIPVSHAHSTYLQILVEGGLAGVIAYMLIILFAFIHKDASALSRYSLLFIAITGLTEPHFWGVVSSGIMILYITFNLRQMYFHGNDISG